MKKGLLILITFLFTLGCGIFEDRYDYEGWDLKEDVKVLNEHSGVDSIVWIDTGLVRVYFRSPTDLQGMLVTIHLGDIVFSPVYSGVMGRVVSLKRESSGNCVLMETEPVPLSSVFSYLYSHDMGNVRIRLKNAKDGRIEKTVSLPDRFFTLPEGEKVWIRNHKAHVEITTQGAKDGHEDECFVIDISRSFSVEITFEKGTTVKAELEIENEDVYTPEFASVLAMHDLQLDTFSMRLVLRKETEQSIKLKGLIESEAEVDSTLVEIIKGRLSPVLDSAIGSVLNSISAEAVMLLPPLGPIPLTARTRIGPFLDVSLGFSGGCALQKLQRKTEEFVWGFEYIEGDLHGINNYSSNSVEFPLFATVTGEVSLELKAGLRFESKVLLADMAGPEFNISGGPYINTGLVFSPPPPRLNFEGGAFVKGGIGVVFQVPIVGTELLRAELSLEGKWKLADYSMYLQDCPGKEKGGCYYVGEYYPIGGNSGY